MTGELDPHERERLGLLCLRALRSLHGSSSVSARRDAVTGERYLHAGITSAGSLQREPPLLLLLPSGSAVAQLSALAALPLIAHSDSDAHLDQRCRAS